MKEMDEREDEMDIYQRRMVHSDIKAVKELITKTLLHRSMLKVYDPSDMCAWDASYSTETLIDIVENSHAYLLIEENTDRVLASGFINLCEDKHSAHIGMIFTDYEVRNLGLGKRIMEILENDEYGQTVDKIILGSAMSAYRFYQKLGYVCKDNEYQITEEKNAYAVPMEKFVRKSL